MPFCEFRGLEFGWSDRFCKDGVAVNGQVVAEVGQGRAERDGTNVGGDTAPIGPGDAIGDRIRTRVCICGGDGFSQRTIAVAGVVGGACGLGDDGQRCATAF